MRASPPFVAVPHEAYQDHRLTLVELRVLLALYGFLNRQTKLCHPHRSKICERSGYAPNTVSRAITGLSRKGWLTRKQGRGPSEIELHVPVDNLAETVPDQETVSDPDTVPGFVVNSARSGLFTVPDPGTPKQIINRFLTEKDARTRMREPESYPQEPQWLTAAAADETNQTSPISGTRLDPNAELQTPEIQAAKIAWPTISTEQMHRSWVQYVGHYSSLPDTHHKSRAANWLPRWRAWVANDQDRRPTKSTGGNGNGTGANATPYERSLEALEARKQFCETAGIPWEH